MKLKIIIGLYAGILLFSGCASNTSLSPDNLLQ